MWRNIQWVVHKPSCHTDISGGGEEGGGGCSEKKYNRGLLKF